MTMKLSWMGHPKMSEDQNKGRSRFPSGMTSKRMTNKGMTSKRMTNKGMTNKGMTNKGMTNIRLEGQIEEVKGEALTGRP